jgi:secreted trypsin-like serine protease
MRHILLITALFFFTNSFANERIQNGWQVPAENSLSRSIARFWTGFGNCSATFISKQYLLTAAHCTYRGNSGGAKIYVRDSNGVVYAAPVKRLITHPQFGMQKTPSSGTFVKNDIALIEISGSFPFPITPIVIGNTNEYMQDENQARIYGYGKLNSTGAGVGTLRWGFMTAIVEPVALFYGELGISMTPEVNQALCEGDSGGPVMKFVNSRRYLIGVNSLSNGCKNTSQVTSKAVIATKYLPWIRQYVSGI